jgi:hypothetical protein
MALILGALTLGSEYGWTTFKTVLTQRPGRLALFFGKLLALGVVLALLVVLTLAAGAASGYVIVRLEDTPTGWPVAGELARRLRKDLLKCRQVEAKPERADRLKCLLFVVAFEVAVGDGHTPVAAEGPARDLYARGSLAALVLGPVHKLHDATHIVLLEA